MALRDCHPHTGHTITTRHDTAQPSCMWWCCRWTVVVSCFLLPPSLPPQPQTNQRGNSCACFFCVDFCLFLLCLHCVFVFSRLWLFDSFHLRFPSHGSNGTGEEVRLTTYINKNKLLLLLLVNYASVGTKKEITSSVWPALPQSNAL